MAKKKDTVVLVVPKSLVLKTIELLNEKIDNERLAEVKRVGNEQISSEFAARLSEQQRVSDQWKHQI